MLWWTMQNAVIAALLAAVVWTICRLARIGPVGRHALWLIVLLKMLTPPMVVWPWSAPLAMNWPSRDAIDKSQTPARVPARDVTIEVPAAAQDQASPRVNASEEPLAGFARPDLSTTPRNVDSTPSSPPVNFPTAQVTRPRIAHVLFDWAFPATLAIWLIGSIAFAMLQCTRIARMLQRLGGATPPCPLLQRRVEILSSQLRVPPIRVRIMPNIGSPLIWSLFRPELWWPAELSTELSDDALCGLIVHELAHVKRRDHWVGWLELLAGCAWWWNPLYWYVRHQLRENAELACDGWVVSTIPRGRRAYGEALLAVCECLSGRTTPTPAIGVGTGGRQFLERRLTMILREQVPLHLPRLGLLIVGVLAAAALPAWSQKTVTREPELTPPATEARSGSLIDGGRTFAPPSGQPIGLPAEAREVLDQLMQQQQEARRAADEKIVQLQQQAIERLKALQDQYARNGQLDEALAIRDRIRQLERPAPPIGSSRSRDRIEPDPGNLSSLRDRVGQGFYFQVTGSTEGPVWGTDIYTDDSRLSTAAVHAGILRAGETGIVRVRIMQGRDSYGGSTRNGITSSGYASWPGSYSIERVQRLASPGPNGNGNPIGSRATSPSPDASKMAFISRLFVELNGAAPAPGQLQAFIREHPQIADALPDPGSLTAYRVHAGMAFYFWVTGSAQGTVWGDRIYTDDSSLAAAAVHAGVLKPGETGIVKVTILPGQASYEGSTRNGVKTYPYADFGGSYRVERLDLGGRRTRTGNRLTEPMRNSYIRQRPDGAGADVIRDNVQDLRGHEGQTFTFDIVGSTSGTVWGTDVYTDDSSLAAAAVHAGILRDQQRGKVNVTILPGQSGYRGSAREGITSQDWGPWQGSFRIAKATGEATDNLTAPAVEPPPAVESLQAYQQRF